jgi:hypothetical protein
MTNARWVAVIGIMAAGVAVVAPACSGDGGTGGGGGSGGSGTTGGTGGGASSSSSSGMMPAVVECEIAIVGGGPGGVHMAYKLTNPPAGTTVTGLSAPSGVCLIEKNDRLGGRIRDVSFGPNPDDVTATGAFRMYDNQYTFALAGELGVTTVAPYDFSNLRGLQDPGGNAGQYFGYSGDAFKSLYGQTLNDDDMWVELLCGAQVPKDASGHPNYAAVTGGIGSKSTVDYANDVLGAQGAKFFFDQNRFRADFTADVDAVGYMEYAAIDWYGSGSTVYPIPGHSALIAKMEEAIKSKGGQIFLSDPVSMTARARDGFTIEAMAHTFHAKQVVVAVPPGALGKIGGDVVASITAAKEFNSVTSAKSMQVTHQWDKNWWKGDLRYPDLSKVVGGDLPQGAPPILRADTTIKQADGSCINSIEFPPTAHHDGLMVTRSVYSDDRTCVDHNLTVYGDGGSAGTQALNDDILKSLRALFPAIFDGSAGEPKIVKTDVNVHDEAWFYLKKGATAAGVTNKSVFDWSVNPVSGKKVYLVGDAWYPLGSGWSNAAYVSSIRVLNEHFGLSLASNELQPVSCP